MTEPLVIGRALCVYMKRWRSSRDSFARIEPATPIHAPSSPGHRYTVRTSSSSQSIAFKQQIHDQLTGAATLPDGLASMQLSFTVGPGRNWLSLWKPAIDAQGRILGNTNPSRPGHPQDGRIVELGLHCQVDHTLGSDVLITINAITQGDLKTRPRGMGGRLAQVADSVVRACACSLWTVGFHHRDRQVSAN